MITYSPVTGSGLTPFIFATTSLLTRSKGKRAMTQRMGASTHGVSKGTGAGQRPWDAGREGEREDRLSVSVHAPCGGGFGQAFCPPGQRAAPGPAA
ncbi:hypothetical protein ScoT_28380 [Streptomyces albidoflavus]|uniref:Uncharacterized protein n=1 Tax=Streptomyces albidoflavus TaxID=1886 RepID=A0AA37C100_9ACTN|nr:hypothetical protein ScoT_28380 [Streptomyces albidoflavus]